MSTSSNSTRRLPPPHPSPTWADAARGRDQARAQLPAASNDSTPARPAHTYAGSLPPPSAHSQYMAWVRCRRWGIPAKLVLETDGCTEEVTLWFHSTAAGGDSSAANTAAHAHPSGKRRRERARRVGTHSVTRNKTEILLLLSVAVYYPCVHYR